MYVCASLVCIYVMLCMYVFLQYIISVGFSLLGGCPPPTSQKFAHSRPPTWKNHPNRLLPHQDFIPPHQGLIPHPPLKNSFHFRTIHILTSHSLYTQDRVSPSGGDCTPPPPLFEKLA